MACILCFQKAQSLIAMWRKKQQSYSSVNFILTYRVIGQPQKTTFAITEQSPPFMLMQGGQLDCLWNGIGNAYIRSTLETNVMEMNNLKPPVADWMLYGFSGL